MSRRVTRDIARVAEIGLIHQGRSSERVTGARRLGIRHRARLAWWSHPAWALVLAVGVVVFVAWWKSW